jgi:hypothetical protein
LSGRSGKRSSKRHLLKAFMPRINTTVGENYVGMGDMISLAWIAEGTRDTADPVSFYATKSNLAVLKMLGQNATDDPSGTGVLVGPAYVTELAERGARLRLDYIRELLGLSTPYKRPRVAVSQSAMRWAEETKQGVGDDLVLLFPQTLWESRAWPPCYWVELAWSLHQRNVPALVMMANEDKRFTNTPRYLWGFSLDNVAALMSVSKLVVGNDSGPAHLSGTIGVPTVVTSGPTRGSCVFGHMPEVISLTNDEPPDCTGCHFGSPFRAACDQGCQALYALKPHVVLGRIVSELALLATDRTTAPAGVKVAS